MKKRSLVAAIALLIVSAVVLTSSTYAWFASSNSALISGITATTGNTSGSIYISANGSAWYTSLTQTNFSSVQGNAFPGSLNPVSFDGTAHTFSSGSLAQNSETSQMVLTAGSDPGATNNYIKFTVHLYAEAACTVTVSPTLTSGCGYVYGAFNKGGTWTLFGAAGNNYMPITHAGTAVDANNDGIIDSTEAAASTDGLTIANAATGISSTATAADMSISYTFVADDPATEDVNESTLGANHAVSFDVYVWAEGQDADCYGQVATDNVGLSLQFTKS